MNRIPSGNSIQSLFTDRDGSGHQPVNPNTATTATSNLRDELLNCEQKDLFQFLQEDFDNSNNYFSDTVGYGAAVIEPDTESLVFDGRGADSLASDRKVSTASLRSNLSSISNSIFQTLEMRRGGSFSGSIEQVLNRLESPIMRKRFSENLSQKDMDREPLMANSEFDCLIESFDKSLTDLKKKSSLSLDRNLAKHLPSPPGERANPEHLPKSISSSSKETATVVRRGRSASARAFDRNSSSVKLKRRSLEKQKKVNDEEFESLPEGRNVKKDNAIINLLPNESPTMRMRSPFNSSYDRIKRSSLIERVEEELEGERMPLRVESEKLPRKEFRIEEDHLKRHHSHETLKHEELGAATVTNFFPLEINRERTISISKSVAPDVPIDAQTKENDSPSSKSAKSGKSSTSSKKSKKSKKSPKKGKG